MTDREDVVLGVILVAIGLAVIGVCLMAAHYIPGLIRAAAQVIVSTIETFPEWAASATLRQWGHLFLQAGAAVFAFGVVLVALFVDDGPVADQDDGEPSPGENSVPLGEFDDQ